MAAPDADPDTADRPNVLFVHTDEQRADTLGCYGADVATPNVDRLARRGVTFEAAHCTHPLCMPSRGTLLTGRYPSAHGCWRNGIPLPGEERAIAELLSGAGYATGLFGKAHFTPYGGDPDEHPEAVNSGINDVDPEDCWAFWESFDGPYYGFEELAMTVAHGEPGLAGGHYGRWLAEHHPDTRELFRQSAAVGGREPPLNSWVSAAPVELHPSTWVADRTIEFVDDHAGERPFFAWVGIPDPHFPYDPPAEYAKRYDPEDVRRPVDPDGAVWGDDPPRYVRYHLAEKYGVDWRTVPEAKRREVIAHYHAMVDLLDDAVGRILAALEDRGIADETVVVFTSDHGDWLGDHGLFQKGLPHTRELTRIPWVVRWPGVAVPGRRVKAPTSQLDLMPTLLDAAGVDVPYGVQGESLRPVLTGERDALRPYALVEHRHEAYREGSFFVRNAGVTADKAGLQDDIVNWGPEPIGVRTVYADGYRLSHVQGADREHGELFDLEADPGETDDLWNTGHPAQSRLYERLAEALVDAADPLPERRYPV